MLSETGVPLFVLMTMLSVAAAVPSPGDAGWFKPALKADHATGLPAEILATDVQPANLLVAPASLIVRENDKEVPTPTLAPVGPNEYAGDSPESNLKLALKYGVAQLPFVEVSLANQTDEARSLSCTLSLPLRPAADRAFFPAGERPRITLQLNEPPISYAYHSGGIRTAMPLGQVYTPSQDWGLAFFGEFGDLIEPFGTSLSRSEQRTLVEIGLRMPCAAKGTATRRIYFAATRGDWRPALGAVLAQFPKAFEPQNPDIAPLHGPFVCSGGTPSDESIQEWYDQGCRVVEIHGTPPFYGEYVPKQEVWTPFCDDKWRSLRTLPPDERPALDAPWQEIQAFVEKRHPPNMTRAKVNDYIDRLHQHGMKGLIYFNPTEAWAPWALANFPDDRRLGPDGKPILIWYEQSAAMIPDKNRAWGKYLLDQIRGELEIYPEVDGVFFDQSAGGGHDLTELCAEGCRIVRARGRICWWNGPYNMELAALADGMMTEGGGSERYRQLTEMIQYYGIAGKPIISLGHANTLGYAEVLAHGVIPKPVGSSQREMAQRWFPLFEWFRNRRWVLDAHALEIQLTTSVGPAASRSGVNANLYRVPDGNLVLPMSRDPLPTDETKPMFSVELTVRVPDADQVRAAYLLAPDLLGYHKLPFSREANEIRITVPRLRPAALLVLAKTGVFPALDGPLHLVRGAQGNIRWVLDNWTQEPKKTLMSLESPLGNGTLEKEVAVGGTLSLEVLVEVPADSAEPRAALTASAQVDGVEMAGKAELWLDPPVLVMAEAPAQVRDDETFAVKVNLLSHLPEKTPVRVEAASKDCQFEQPAQTVTVMPEKLAALELKARPTRAGDALIRVKAVAPDDVTASVQVPVQVLATALAPGGLDKVRAGKLVFDTFGVGAGRYAHKPIAINGVEIANVPGPGGDAWSNDKVMPLPAEALKTLRERNEITIGNEVGDAFKVRNFRLILRMRGGISVVSSVDRGVYTGWKDWLYGEGKQFASTEPLTGITVNIPIDPNRTERYEEFFGVPKSGRLILEINGADGGRYAHKPVSINNRPVGDLPTAGDWREVSMDLTADALESLMTRNEVVIENSQPPDAFKVRRARIQIENTEGDEFVTETEEGAYTSVGWKFAEGKVGSPIRFSLQFRRP